MDQPQWKECKNWNQRDNSAIQLNTLVLCRPTIICSCEFVWCQLCRDGHLHFGCRKSYHTHPDWHALCIATWPLTTFHLLVQLPKEIFELIQKKVIFTQYAIQYMVCWNIWREWDVKRGWWKKMNFLPQSWSFLIFSRSLGKHSQQEANLSEN